LSTGVCPLPTPVVWSFARPLRKPWTSLTAISFPQCSGWWKCLECFDVYH
jgi:hypothetical protein